MARQAKSESKLTEAADKATALLQGLQSRLSGQVGSPADTPDALERQLREYFVAESGKLSDTRMLDQIRDRVVEAVADRILESWESGDRRELRALESQVIDRVAERILERMAPR